MDLHVGLFLHAMLSAFLGRFDIDHTRLNTLWAHLTTVAARQGDARW